MSIRLDIVFTDVATVPCRTRWQHTPILQHSLGEQTHSDARLQHRQSGGGETLGPT